MEICGAFILFILAHLIYPNPEAYDALKMLKQSNLPIMCKHAILILRNICQGIDAILFLRPKVVFYCEISRVLFQPCCVLTPGQMIYVFFNSLIFFFFLNCLLSAQLKVVFDLIPLGGQEGGKNCLAWVQGQKTLIPQKLSPCKMKWVSHGELIILECVSMSAFNVSQHLAHLGKLWDFSNSWSIIKQLLFLF